MRYSILLVAAAALLLSSCVTRPKTYAAPDRTKVVQTTKRLSAAIDRANETTVRAEAKVQETQASADRVAGHSASVIQLIRELEPNIPAELKPKFDELKNSADAQIAEEGVLSKSIAGARGEIDQLKKDHAVVVQEKERLVEDQAQLFTAGEKVARDATDERNARIAAEKQLVQQKLFRWLWRIGGGAAVLLLIVVVLLAIFGKLGIALSKLGIKVAG